MRRPLRSKRSATASRSLDPTAPHPATDAWLSVVRAYHLCEATLSHRLAAIGVELDAHEVLINLIAAPGLSQQDLARRCFVAKSNMSMLVSRLEREGILVRQVASHDARVRELTLTKTGVALAKRCRAAQNAHIELMVDGLNADHITGLSATMEHVTSALKAMAARSK